MHIDLTKKKTILFGVRKKTGFAVPDLKDMFATERFFYAFPWKAHDVISLTSFSFLWKLLLSMQSPFCHATCVLRSSVLKLLEVAA